MVEVAHPRRSRMRKKRRRMRVSPMILRVFPSAMSAARGPPIGAPIISDLPRIPVRAVAAVMVKVEDIFDG